MPEYPSRDALDGPWLFRADPEQRGELFPEELNRPHRADARWMDSNGDDNWTPITVGATWNGQGHDFNGVAWYRTPLPDSTDAARSFIEFEAVDYYADVWLNGRCLGSHEGPFTSFSYELTRHLQSSGNRLAVRVDSPVTAPGYLEETDQLKTLFKGVLERADTNNPNLVTGGISGPVHLIRTGPVRLSSTHIEAIPLDNSTALGRRADSLTTVTCGIDGPARGDAVVRLSLSRPDGATVHTSHQRVRLTGSLQIVTFQTVLKDAELWWSWDLGEPALHEAHVVVECDASVSDRASARFGVRSIRRGDGWATYLNGLRVYQRGANYVCEQLRENATPARYRHDIALLKGANLNTVHPFCVVERQEFYDLCDEEGLLVYQDFPVWMTVDDGSDTLRRALSMQAELISQLRNHPSVIVWNNGSQASVANARKICSALADQATRLDPNRISNLTNAAVAFEAETIHLTHPRRSFFWDVDHARALVTDLDWRWDTHQYQGWYTGEVDDIDKIPRHHLSLVTEFGAQGLPEEPMLSTMLTADELWPPDWPAWARHCAQPDLLRQRVRHPDSLAEFIAASQELQAQVVKRHAEFYRRLRFDPCNGAHVFMFVDYWPGITWSLVDYERSPKLAYHAYAQSMSPCQVLLNLPVDRAPFRSKSAAEIAVVNDTRATHPHASVSILVDDIEVARHEPVQVLANSLTELPPLDMGDLVDESAHQIVCTLHSADGRQIAANHYRIRGDPFPSAPAAPDPTVPTKAAHLTQRPTMSAAERKTGD